MTGGLLCNSSVCAVGREVEAGSVHNSVAQMWVYRAGESCKLWGGCEVDRVESVSSIFDKCSYRHHRSQEILR